MYRWLVATAHKVAASIISLQEKGLLIEYYKSHVFDIIHRILMFLVFTSKFWIIVGKLVICLLLLTNLWFGYYCWQTCDLFSIVQF